MDKSVGDQGRRSRKIASRKPHPREVGFAGDRTGTFDLSGHNSKDHCLSHEGSRMITDRAFAAFIAFIA
jgi:hypothetical protein